MNYSKDALPKIDILVSKLNGFRAPIKESDADINAFLTADDVSDEMMMKINWIFWLDGEEYLNFARGSFVDKEDRVVRIYLYRNIDKRNLAVKILYMMQGMMPEEDYCDTKKRYDFFNNLNDFDSLVLDTIAGSHCKSIESIAPKASKDDDLPF